MSDDERFKAGDKVHVAIGGRYLPGRVVSSFLWSHSSGNSFRAYRVAVGDWHVTCSANSIREFAEKPRQPRAKK